MKAPKEAAWENVLTRYFAAVGIPLRWRYHARRFLGIAGHEFARINPKSVSEAGVWSRMPDYINKYEKLSGGKQVVIFVTNREYGDSVDDSLVVLRLGAFAPMLKAMVDTDKERWTNESSVD